MPRISLSTDHEIIGNAIGKLLSNAASASGFVYEPEPLTLKLVDGDRIVGGLAGATNWDWLYIEKLAVAAGFRGRGLGRKLVAEAEQAARERSCRGVWVDTFSFQSPDFYLRLGYKPFGELTDYPTGQCRMFLQKILGETSM